MKIKQQLINTAAKNNYTINESRLPILTEKFRQQWKQYGEMYCPCQNKRNHDTICPCRYMRKYDSCKCGLYSAGE